MSTISIIIPAYNHAKTIRACLDSLFSQTRLADEILVIDDASTDQLEKVLEPYLHKITYVRQKENQGACLTRNHGFKHSKGEFVLFCDADLVLQENMLEKLESHLEKVPEASYAYCQFRFGWKRFSSFAFSEARLRQMNYIHTSALIRRGAFPGFDPSLKRFQDWDLWLTMLEQGFYGIFVKEELFRILVPRGRSGISAWRPKWMYKIPWEKFGWIPGSVNAYNQAKRRIIDKHDLV